MSAIECSAVEFATSARQSNRDQPDALIRAVKKFMSPMRSPYSDQHRRQGLDRSRTRLPNVI